jgi:L-glyceraldehyde 3-phosphate reductase
MMNPSTPYRRCGSSGLDLPAVSLGLWHNFCADTLDRAKAMAETAFDLGITHLDLANNYGPPPGSAEETLGAILAGGLGRHRDELILSTKAGYRMGPGPYGDGGSRKYLLSSLDASLRRMRIEYVDVFYHHRPDPSTPLEETMGALASAVRQGKALYVGVSNYDAGRTAAAAALLRQMGVRLLIHQPRYSLLDRRPEQGLFATLEAEGVGCIVFSPLEQGILAAKYNEGIPVESRAASATGFLRPEHLSEEKIRIARELARLAREGGRTPAQLALAWTLRLPVVTSALIGASSPGQIRECAACLERGPLDEETLRAIEAICAG